MSSHKQYHSIENTELTDIEHYDAKPARKPKAILNDTIVQRARTLIYQRNEKQTAIAKNPHADDKEIAAAAEAVSNLDRQIAECVLLDSRTDAHGYEVIASLMSGLAKLNATEGTVRGSDLSRDDRSCILEAGRLANVLPDDSLSLPPHIIERMRKITL